MRKTLAVLAIAAALALFGIACGSSDEQTSGGATNTRTAGGATQQITIKDFSFAPAQFSAKAGETIQVQLENAGSVMHTFTIDSLSIDKTLNPGEKATVSVTPSGSGDVQFYCRFHKASNGMTGTISLGGVAGAATTKAAASTSSTSAGGGYHSGY